MRSLCDRRFGTAPFWQNEKREKNKVINKVVVVESGNSCGKPQNLLIKQEEIQCPKFGFFVEKRKDFLWKKQPSQWEKRQADPSRRTQKRFFPDRNPKQTVFHRRELVEKIGIDLRKSGKTPDRRGSCRKKIQQAVLADTTRSFFIFSTDTAGSFQHFPTGFPQVWETMWKTCGIPVKKEHRALFSGRRSLR